MEREISRGRKALSKAEVQWRQKKKLKQQRETTKIENKAVERKQRNYENGIWRTREAKELKQGREQDTSCPLGIHLAAIRR